MIRFWRVILFILISPLISHAEAGKPPSLRPPTNLFAGLGPAFSVSGGAVGFAQVGGDFFIAGTKNLRFLMGPQANVFFGHGKNLNFGFIGLNLKLSHEKILSDNTRLDIYARMPFQIGFGSSHGSNALGFNMGLHPGFAFYFNNMLGIYTELGAQGMIHILFSERRPPTYLLMNINLGLTFTL